MGTCPWTPWTSRLPEPQWSADENSVTLTFNAKNGMSRQVVLDEGKKCGEKCGERCGEKCGENLETFIV